MESRSQERQIISNHGTLPKAPKNLFTWSYKDSKGQIQQSGSVGVVVVFLVLDVYNITGK